MQTHYRIWSWFSWMSEKLTNFDDGQLFTFFQNPFCQSWFSNVNVHSLIANLVLMVSTYFVENQNQNQRKVTNVIINLVNESNNSIQNYRRQTQFCQLQFKLARLSINKALFWLYEDDSDSEYLFIVIFIRQMLFYLLCLKLHHFHQYYI